MAGEAILKNKKVKEMFRLKRILGALMALIMALLNLSALCVSAAEVSGDYRYFVENGNATISAYIGNGGDVEMPETIGGYPVTKIGERAFYRCESLTSISIPGSVTSIGEMAFLGCTALTSITIPENVTNIGQGTFNFCTGLTSANILNSVIGEAMFGGCTALTMVNISGNVTSIAEVAFSGCVSLETITIPESVANIGYNAFAYCQSLKSVIFNNPDTKFEENDNNKNPHVPRASTFHDCDSLSTMYAFKGSQAQTYALNKQINFIPIARVQLDGQRLKFDVPPIIENGRVLVPMRAIFETLGAEIGWDSETSTVTATTADKSITMQVGNPQIQVHGEMMTLDVPPQIILDRTFVPVRAVSESLGAAVDWDEDAQTVIIHTQ